MDLITHVIPNMFNGVSQQAPSSRQEGQCQEQINCSNDIVEGCGKRHPATFVANLSATYSNNDFIFYIHRDDVEKYAVRITSTGAISVWGIDGSTRTVTTPNGAGYVTTANPQANLVALTIADYTFIVNKTVAVQMLAGSAASFSAGNSSWQLYSQITQPYTMNMLYTITGDNTSGFGQYYCTPQSTSGPLVECTVNGILNSIDPNTMPMVLIRNANGTFTLKQGTWANRLIGDLLSANNPSFVGHTINNMVFYQNRLWFLSGENVISSRAGNYWNFWPETATQMLDSDPIDVSVTSNIVATLYAAVPFNGNLVLFSENAQYMLTTQSTLTPKTVQVAPSTTYSCSKYCQPQVSGSNVYFAVPGSLSTAIREYFVQPYQLTYLADDITAQCPTYIPTGITGLVTSSIRDIILCWTGSNSGFANTDTSRTLYTYKYYWNGSTKLQSSWGRWMLPVGYNIINCTIINTQMYIICGTPDGLTLLMLDLQPKLTDIGNIAVSLDNRVSLTGTYSSTTGLTTWSLPYDPPTSVQVVLGASFSGQAASTVQTATRSGYRSVTAIGDYSAGSAYVGIPYTMQYTFSPQYFKDSNHNPRLQAGLKLRNMMVIYQNSMYFRATVTPYGRQTYTYQFSGKLLGTNSATLGSPQVGTGYFKFPVMTAGDTVTMQLINDSPYPSFFQSAEWEGFISLRAQPV